MTLICLISGQLAPNLLSVLQIMPDSVWLVHTADTKSNAEHFRALLQADYSIAGVDMHEVHPFDPVQIRREATWLAEKRESSEAVLNYTAGTKPMAVEFVRVFEQAGASILYVDTQDEIFWLSKNGETARIPFNFRFRLNTFFNLKEMAIKTETHDNVIAELSDLTELIFQERIKKINSELQLFVNNAIKHRVQKENLDYWRPKLSYQEIHIQNESDTRVKVSWNGKPIALKKKIPWFEYFSGGWFEFWCYSVLKNSGYFDDVRCNIKILPAGKSKPENLKNELDVVAIANAVPLYMECKSGNLDQKSITNLDAVRNYYGPKYSQGLLVSLRPVTDNVLREKINDYNLGLVEGPENIKEKILDFATETMVRL